MELIRNIHSNFDSLCENYKTLPETDIAYDALDAYLESLGIFEKEGMKDHRRKVYNLIADLGLENERQGFIYGFKYSLSLVMEALGDI